MFEALVSFHNTILQSWKFQENLGQTVAPVVSTELWSKLLQAQSEYFQSKTLLCASLDKRGAPGRFMDVPWMSHGRPMDQSSPWAGVGVASREEPFEYVFLTKPLLFGAAREKSG